MPRRVKQRRRGKGSTTYRAVSHRFKAVSSYKTYDEAEKNNQCKGEVLDLVHDPARSAPLMIVRFNEQTVALPAPLGVMKGQQVEAGVSAEVKPGNNLPLKSIPDGTVISNIELTPGDGGKLVRSAGGRAKIVSHDNNQVMVKLNSKAVKSLNSNCRATVGVIAGSGHKNKPLVKAGKNFHKRKAKGLKWPVVSGTSKQASEHPHGGKQHRKRKSRTVSRHAPPGAKVGSFAAKRTGRGGKRRKK
ncbi:50S ribosomal protein L2 [archaeon]|nr:50S ribosomal protein L2 [archaeon]